MKKDYIYNLGSKLNAIVNLSPSSIAIYFPEGHSYSFKELEELSNQYSYFLSQLGLGKGDVIAILNTKSLHGLGLMLGAVKIGIIYTNLDPASPVDRLKKMLERCSPKFLFIDNINSTIELEAVSKYKVIYLKEIIENVLAQINQQHSKQKEVVSSDPAYIMFTSGSTGFPKGAVMSHGNLLNLIDWAKETYHIDGKDRFTGVNPIYFDNSVFDFYASIFNGASLVPFTIEHTKKPKELVALVSKSDCTNWFSVPSMLIYLLTTKALKRDDFKSVKKIAFGGEGFPKQQLLKLYKYFGNRVELHNVYGPTECTCICSSYLIKENDFENMNNFAPLGSIANNFDYYISQSSESSAVEGELCLLGPNVGLGYYNDRERTENSFIQHPERKYKSLMYQTGDIVYVDEKGLLQIKGRSDNQIKHLGYRIELEEVESGMSQIDGVKESAALYKNLGNGMGFIIGFLAIDQEIKYAQFKEILESILPSYMIPREIRLLSVLPKNQNGKVDRMVLKEKI